MVFILTYYLLFYLEICSHKISQASLFSKDAIYILSPKLYNNKNMKT